MQGFCGGKPGNLTLCGMSTPETTTNIIHTYIHSYRHTYRQRDIQTDKQTDGRTDTHRDIHPSLPFLHPASHPASQRAIDPCIHASILPAMHVYIHMYMLLCLCCCFYICRIAGLTRRIAGLTLYSVPVFPTVSVCMYACMYACTYVHLYVFLGLFCIYTDKDLPAHLRSAPARESRNWTWMWSFSQKSTMMMRRIPGISGSSPAVLLRVAGEGFSTSGAQFRE